VRSSPGTEETIEILEVRSRAELDRFICVADTLSRSDPAWIPPLLAERRAALTPAKNPFFRHAEACFWIARRGGRDVGRISAQEDSLVPRGPDGGRVGHFGMLAAEDDPAVFAALLATAEAWLAARGLRQVLGPFSLSVNEETGLLVSGFDTPPMLMMPHDPPHAGRHVEAAGYRKAKDLIAYICDDSTVTLPPAAAAIAARPLPPGVTIRPMRKFALKQEVTTLVEIFNDAWSGNWGFVPLTPEEVDHMARMLRPLLHEQLVWFAEVRGEPAAFIVCLPNLNEAIRDLRGRLLPFGWARLLWRLKVAGLATGRVPLFGVRRSLGGTGLSRSLPFHLMAALRREALAMGFRAMEFSWVLEDNAPMRRLAEAVGGRAYKTYRVYEKALPA
jgi:hypothetical protein